MTFGSLDSQAGKIGFSLPPIMLALILFNAGLGVKTRELGQLLQNPKLLLGGVVGNLATPLVFILALKYAMGIWHNPEEVQQILMGLALWVVLPSLLGILTHKWLGEARLEPARHWLKLSNYIILILLNYSNAALTLPKVLSEPDPDFLAIMIVIVTGLCITAFATGYGLAQLLKADRPSMISLMFGLGMNNNGTGLVLASMALSDHAEIMIPIIFYNLTQHIVAAAIDRFWIQPTDAIRP